MGNGPVRQKLCNQRCQEERKRSRFKQRCQISQIIGNKFTTCRDQSLGCISGIMRRKMQLSGVLQKNKNRQPLNVLMRENIENGGVEACRASEVGMWTDVHAVFFF